MYKSTHTRASFAPLLQFITCEAGSATFAATELWHMRLRHGRISITVDMGPERSEGVSSRIGEHARASRLYRERIPVTEHLVLTQQAQAHAHKQQQQRTTCIER